MDTRLAEMHWRAIVRSGFEELDRGEGIPDEELKKQLEEWRREKR